MKIVIWSDCGIVIDVIKSKAVDDLIAREHLAEDGWTDADRNEFAADALLDYVKVGISAARLAEKKGN